MVKLLLIGFLVLIWFPFGFWSDLARMFALVEATLTLGAAQNADSVTIGVVAKDCFY